VNKGLVNEADRFGVRAVAEERTAAGMRNAAFRVGETDKSEEKWVRESRWR
jgi:hypothetical protein